MCVLIDRQQSSTYLCLVFEESKESSVPILRPLVLLIVVALSGRLRIVALCLTLLRTTSAAKNGTIESTNSSTAASSPVNRLTSAGCITRFRHIRTWLSRVCFESVFGRGVGLRVCSTSTSTCMSTNRGLLTEETLTMVKTIKRPRFAVVSIGGWLI